MCEVFKENLTCRGGASLMHRNHQLSPKATFNELMFKMCEVFKENLTLRDKKEDI